MTEPGTELTVLDPDDWAIAFLNAFTGKDAYGVLSRAARAAGVHVNTVTRRREDDLTFRTLLEQAEDEIRDLVRHEVFRRALEPSQRPIFQRGEMVGTIEEYDNRHLEWLAERFLPEEFHLATKIELTAPNKGDGAFTFRMGEDDILEQEDRPALEPGNDSPET